MARSNRALGVTGGLFVVAFAVRLALLADELGAFADSDQAFIDHFSTGSQRGADIAGAVLLVAAAATFIYFTHLIASVPSEDLNQLPTSGLVRIAGIFTGGLILVAALALVTVPLSISLGEFFDEDSGAFGQGQAVLPQFGFVALVFGAMIQAALWRSHMGRPAASCTYRWVWACQIAGSVERYETGLKTEVCGPWAVSSG